VRPFRVLLLLFVPVKVSGKACQDKHTQGSGASDGGKCDREGCKYYKLSHVVIFKIAIDANKAMMKGNATMA
jgi:hypothetical protein